MEKIVVLLHGFGEDHTIFKEQINALERDYSIFAPDLPGSGQLSNYQWQPGTENIDWLADWVKEQLDAKGISTCIMLGHSMGGYITLSFAEKYPERLRAFGLIHSTAYADSAQKKENRAKAIDFMLTNGPHTFLKTAIPGLFGPAFLDKHHDVVEGLIEKGRQFEAASLIAYYRAMMHRPSRENILRESRIPFLLVAGTEDMAAPLSDLLQQSSLAPITHFHILQQVGHMGMLEDPANLNRILLNFLAAV